MDFNFINISLILGIAIAIAFVIQLLRQPLIISYIITGIVCGPLFLNLINANLYYFDVFAELGVILLLFLVGLSLNLSYLKKIGKVVVIAGVGQVIFTSVFGFLILLLLGFEKAPAIYLAVSITFSSTIVIMKLLSDKSETRTVHGRYTVGLMLVQDLIAISIMILLPTFKSETTIVYALLVLFLKVFIIITTVFLLARYVLPLVLDRAAKSGEFLLIFTLAWCFAMAGFGEFIGLSLEIGAIMAGISLGSSVYQTEISSRIKPLRDFFIALFFIILGSEMVITNYMATVIPGIILSVFVLVGNPIILYWLFRRMKFARRISFLVGLIAAQVSEFGFVFLFIAKKMGYINDDIISVFTLVALSTIFISSFLITYNVQIFNKLRPIFNLFGKDKYINLKESHKKYEVLVIGYHRLGWTICSALQEKNISFAVVDYDPLVVKKLSERGIDYFFGDATDVEFLNELPLDDVKIIISTLPRSEEQMTLINHIRLNPKKPIIVSSLAHLRFLDDMYEAGVDYVVVPHLLSGHWMADIIRKGVCNRRTFNKLKRQQNKDLLLRTTLVKR